MAPCNQGADSGPAMTLASIQKALSASADRDEAKQLSRFFKTGPGQYGEGDRFRGIRVPILRKLARQYRDMTRSEVKKLLHSAFHEDRLTALLILIEQYRRGSARDRERIVNLYMRSTRYINNWDLVDVTAEHIPGAWLFDKDRGVLFEFAGSDDLWKRRIAILSTFHFIRKGDFADTLRIAEILLGDEHDLIHKAVGWMLREVGNRDRACEERFLKKHYRTMPRTMLRYAIEKFPEPLRRKYLRGNV